MDFETENDSIPCMIMEEISSSQPFRAQSSQLVYMEFVDAETLKNFLESYTKNYQTIKFEFHHTGILAINIKNRSPSAASCIPYDSVSVIHFPAENLKRYLIREENLPAMQRIETDPLFTLEFQAITLFRFLKDYKIQKLGFSYNTNSPTAELINISSQKSSPLQIQFGHTSTILPLNHPITEPKLKPIATPDCLEFTTCAYSLTKTKTQLSYNMYIEFQYNQETDRGGCIVYSSDQQSQRCYAQALDDFDKREHSKWLFEIDPNMMKSLGLTSKYNKKGFIEYYCLDDVVLKMATYIGNFGRVEHYIFSKTQ